MKKSILFAAIIAAFVMLFASCNNDGAEVPAGNEGWTEFLKIDSDPATFSVDDTQSKFQFQLKNFEVEADAVLSFCFIPCETCTGSVTFRDVTNGEKWFYNQPLPADVGGVLEGVAEDCTITKLDDKWFECKVKVSNDLKEIGFTFVLPDVPDGSEVAYLKDFVIVSGDKTTRCKIDEFSVVDSESDYTFEKYVVSSGIRAQVVSSLD